jgi:hypothetical protein
VVTQRLRHQVGVVVAMGGRNYTHILSDRIWIEPASVSSSFSFSFFFSSSFSSPSYFTPSSAFSYFSSYFSSSFSSSSFPSSFCGAGVFPPSALQPFEAY